MMRHPEHHQHVPTAMQRNRINMQQLGPPPQRMLMTVPSGPPGVLVPMPSALITSMQHQPKNNGPQMFYEPISNDTPAELPPKQPNPQQQQQQVQKPKAPLPNTTTSSNVPNLANMKEKTPMCLVNELARYNKIQHQYKLTGEQGPDHKKIFTVTLRLGSEEYEAEGPSIKKAQHSAAALALQQTQLRRPPPKTTRIIRPGGGMRGSGVVTPTVELNALAMKRGERTTYFVDSGMPPQSQNYLYPYYGRHNMFTPRYNYDTRRNPNMRNQYQYDNRYHNQYKPNFHTVGTGELCTVRLRVGEREYTGRGPTVQCARHDAASKAIAEIKKLNEENLANEKGKDLKEETSAVENGAEVPQDINAELKSPISLVYEIALRRKLNVLFDIKSEDGPPHMKEFVTTCQIGEVIVEGEGNGKKVSKTRAAEKMLQKLSQFAPLPPAINNQVKKKKVTTKKKARNLIKVNDEKSTETVEEVNPICRLIQMQQANKEREPTYTLVDERGSSRKREFVIEASVNGVSAKGIGPNKKMAKRNAAQALLAALEYGNSNASAITSPTLTKSEEKAEISASASEKTRKVTFLEDKQESPIGGSGGRQLVPGLLLVNDQSSHNKTKPTDSAHYNNDTANNNNNNKKVVPQKLQPAPQGGVRSKDKLLYLAQLMNIQAQFSDFPKANHEMFLTLVSLSTTPPQVCHGEGPTIEASHEKAAMEALNVLSEMGLDNTPPNKEQRAE